MKRITIFCGSNPGSDRAYIKACEDLAEIMSRKNLDLVYGGGNVGLMGHLADSMLEKGGKVIGIIPERLINKEVAHKGLTELIITKNMHDRKAKMAELSDAFIALPGGIGTLEEIMEALTWTQLGYHLKPCGILNINGFYDHLNSLLETMVNNRFLDREHKEILSIHESAETLLNHILLKEIVYKDKWIKV